MLSVTGIESCVVRGEYRILCCPWRVYSNLVLSVASIEILCCPAIIESCVVCDEYRILCCL